MTLSVPRTDGRLTQTPSRGDGETAGVVNERALDVCALQHQRVVINRIISNCSNDGVIASSITAGPRGVR